MTTRRALLCAVALAVLIGVWKWLHDSGVRARRHMAQQDAWHQHLRARGRE